MGYTESQDSLDFDEKDDLDTKPFLNGGGQPQNRPKTWTYGRHWMFLTLAFATISSLQLILRLIPSNQMPGFQTGFSTELCMFICLGAAPTVNVN